jgi:hypothetical protein
MSVRLGSPALLAAAPAIRNPSESAGIVFSMFDSFKSDAARRCEIARVIILLHGIRSAWPRPGALLTAHLACKEASTAGVRLFRAS